LWEILELIRLGRRCWKSSLSEEACCRRFWNGFGLAEDAGRVASLKKLVVGDFGIDSAWQKMLEEWPL
jgi:hypothetical protein